MMAMLQKAGIDTENQVDYCISGKEMVDQVKMASRFNIQYRVIFTDFSMPVMDGI